MHIDDFQKFKKQKQKIAMVTCYDYTFARIVAQSNIPCVLVGDSVAMVMHGHKTTLPATMEMMEFHTRAVASGIGNKFLVADMPFMSYQKNLSESLGNMERLMRAGACAVKMEGALDDVLVKQACRAGVPIMGHLGLTPQSYHTLSGYKVQGKDDKSQELILEAALRLEEAGAFALVLECIPSHLAEKITNALSIPTIGIGAGAKTDGQVLVITDLLGLNEKVTPKFVRLYEEGFSDFLMALNRFHGDVQLEEFPIYKESYL